MLKNSKGIISVSKIEKRDRDKNVIREKNLKPLKKFL